MPAFQAAGRDGLSSTFHGKFCLMSNIKSRNVLLLQAMKFPYLHWNHREPKVNSSCVCLKILVVFTWLHHRFNGIATLNLFCHCSSSQPKILKVGIESGVFKICWLVRFLRAHLCSVMVKWKLETTSCLNAPYIFSRLFRKQQLVNFLLVLILNGTPCFKTLFFCCIGEQKFGRTDASSPVPTSLNQTVTLPQGHMQQQGFINATTMPPYYGGLAFYPGAGMMAGGFPAYTTPMYQVCSCKSYFAAFKSIICAWYQYCFTKGATLSERWTFAWNLQGPVAWQIHMPVLWGNHCPVNKHLNKWQIMSNGL